jgi:chitinase|tara:strand:- start:2877 stop:3143 length:267 start_codon:yes stop_codon:yes gene_type:complete
MASVKNLKKDLNNVIGEIIQNINLWELDNSDKDLKESEKLVDKCFNVFDDLIKKIHQKDIKDKKNHYKTISLELTKKASDLVKSFNEL